MFRSSTAVLSTAVLGLLLVVSISSANMITYIDGSPNQKYLMVMEDTGANPVAVHEYPKFSIVGAGHSVSPPGPDGTWIVFEDYDLYKVRADGTGLIKMLCYQGTDAYGAAYTFYGDPQWSPDGSEILVTVAGELPPRYDYVALLPADAEVGSDPTGGEDCASEVLTPIPYFQRVTDDPWGFEGQVAWNDDGSNIAFFEHADLPGEGPSVRLFILERQGTEWVPADPEPPLLYPNPESLGISFQLLLDWQRGGDGYLLAFVAREETGRRPNFWLASIDATTGQWWYLLDGGNRIEGRGLSWSPDGSQLMFSDPQDRLVKWTYPDGPVEVLASGKYPDWQRDSITICGDSECEGTENSCNCPEDCGFAPPTEMLCTDSIDNDCDGDIDCDDFDCGSDPACLPPYCGDGSCNGTEDSCWCPDDCGSPPSTELICDDSLDNDCDVAIDCSDTDCFEDPSCVSIDCSQFGDKKSCNAEPDCRWDNRNKMCVPN